MTDTFPSGFSTPPTPGTAQDAGGPAGDVTSTLAELERKLRELERELTSIGRRRVRPEGATAEAPTAEVTREATGRLIDEQVEPERPWAAPEQATPKQAAPEQAAQVQWATPAERATPVEQVASMAPAAALEDVAAEPLAPAAGASSDARLASLAELRRFRDRVERFAKELTDDYDAMLGRAMAGLSGRANESPREPGGGPHVSTEPPRTSTQPPRAAAEPPQTLAESPLDQVSARAPDPPSRGPEEALFEGRVELGVGPFYDIGSLGAFEQSLATLPCVLEVAVRRFEASHAVVDLRLAAPVALVSELRSALQTDFSIRRVAEGRILLTFDDA